MRVGTDSSKFPGSTRLGAAGTLRAAAELGLDGVFFRSPFELSATMDATELADIAGLAAELGLYLECGVAKVNPFATPEAPQIRAFGEGDYLGAMTRIIEALAGAGITELWTATANYQFRYGGNLLACDRFRTDVTWADQLAATAKVLDLLAPVLRGAGAHLNIETHEEISSFETVRLVEDGGPDAFGITFDIANVVVRGEDPLAAARRAAPYVRTTHVRDVVLARVPEGIGRFLATVGTGIIDWPALLGVLAAAPHPPTLSIEGVIGGRAGMPLHVDDPRWRPAHPDLTDAELALAIAAADRHALDAAAGLAPTLAELQAPLDDTDALAFVVDSAAALRGYLTDLEPTTSPMIGAPR